MVQWTTAQLMLILEILLDLKSKQGDVTAAFLCGELGDDEKVYVVMPLGFRKAGKVLKLNKLCTDYIKVLSSFGLDKCHVGCQYASLKTGSLLVHW